MPLDCVVHFTDPTWFAATLKRTNDASPPPKPYVNGVLSPTDVVRSG